MAVFLFMMVIMWIYKCDFSSINGNENEIDSYLIDI